MQDFDWRTLLIFLGLTFAVSSSGAIFRPGPWYDALVKPRWTPPKWAFPLVWTILYIMIAISGWLVWETAGWSAGPALALYGLQLVLNAAWSAIFFGMKRLDVAMAEVIALWLSIAALIAAFQPIHTLAAWLLVPYLAWVTVAAALNYRLLRLNGAKGPLTLREASQ